MANTPEADQSSTVGAIFLDPNVPDLQTLIDGAAPGEQVFVLKPDEDGLEQIAADLAAAHLTDLSSIAIVAHGASGELQLGASTLDDSALGTHKAALAAIGAALGQKGKLELYACDVAAGAAGKTFIADLSQDAGGADVAAATHEIGKTATGENWTLDASTAAKPTPAVTPFTAAATQSYQGTLPAAQTGADGQLIGAAYYAATGTQSYYLNSNSTTLQAFGTDTGSYSLAVDPTLGALFELKVGPSPDHPTLYIGNLTPGGAAPVISSTFESYYQAHFGADSPNNTQTGQSIAIDTLNHRLYIPIGSVNTNQNGLLVMSYSTDSSGTTTILPPSFLENSAGNAPPSYFNNGAVYDYITKNVYIDDTDDSNNGQVGAENGLFRIPTGGSGHVPVSIVNNNGLGAINGLALDAVHNRLFFATSSETKPSDPSTFVDNLYVLNNPDTASNATPTALTYAPNVAAPTYGEIVGVAYDDNSNVLYVTNNYVGTTTSDYKKSEIDALQLSADGTQVTGVTRIPYLSLSSATPGFLPFGPVTYDPLSSLTVAGTGASVAAGKATTLLANAPTITDYDSGGYLQSASVKITDGGNVVSGDTLGLVKNGTFNTFTSTPTAYVDNGHTFNVSYANGVLTIANQVGSAGENTIASYSQVLQDVQYQNNSTNTDTRTATFQVNNGAIGNPSGSINTKSFTVVIAQPPVIAAGGYQVPGDVLEGATATADSPGALTGDASPAGSGSLSVTAVDGAAGNVGNATAGTYGHLTLQSNGSYSYAADNTGAIDAAATGSHPMDGYTFTVSNTGGSANETFTATIDRAPTGSGVTDSAVEGMTTTAGTGAAFAHEMDADGDSLSVASVSYNGTPGTVGGTVTGKFGDLTLNADGSYSYNANNLPAYVAAEVQGQPTTDDFTYTSTDGLGGTTTPQTLEFQVTCFATGTRIRVARGEEGVEGAAIVDVAVEALQVGDLAMTASGAARPVRWIGHRTIDCRAYPQPRDAWPIRVAANAFGDGLPSADLFLSSGHSVKLGVMDDVLIPIGKLINGATIARHPVDEVTYWHVELDSHDVLLANDLPAESFLDCGNRDALLEQAGAYDRLAGPHTPADFCLPYIDAGPVVDAVRARLALRAARLGWTTTREVDLHLMVDGARVDPDVVGTIARFIFPATATHVVLASATGVPSDLADVIDHRRLGVSIHGLEVDDGLSDRVHIALDDERIAGAWHRAEAEAGCFHRFTDGHLPLPPALWADCRGQVLLRVHHDPQGGIRWIAPASEAPNVVPLRTPV